MRLIDQDKGTFAVSRRASQSPRTARIAGVTGLLALSLAAGAVPAGPAHAIAGGSPAAAGAYTFVAKVDVADVRSCTGALIDPRWVVTAASCFADAPGQAVPAGPPKQATTVTIGRADLSSSAGHVLNVLRLVPHPDRNLILAKLATRITDVAPIKIGTTAPATGDVLRVAAYGRTATEWVPDLLHTAPFAVQNVAATTFDIVGQDSAHASTCKGDSGGPAFRESNGAVELVGLNSSSWQRGCYGSIETREGTTETRIDDIGGWIKENIRERLGGAGTDLLGTDLNGDSTSDVALTGGQGWNTLPVALSKGDGSFGVTNTPIGNWGVWASAPGVQVLAGDFNGDGRSDLALTGGNGWNTLPVALSKGDGSFTVTNAPITSFASWTTIAGTKVLTGDYNGDGRTDLAVTGGNGWDTLPVALSKGDGSFDVTNIFIGNWAVWVRGAGAKLLTGDYNGDGRTDLALTGGNGWNTLPVALSKGDGSFTVTNTPITSFASWTTNAGTKVLTGDYNGDGRTDHAVTGGNGWNTLPVALSKGDGSFTVTNTPITSFASWTTIANVKVLTGDYNGDGRTDHAVVGGHGWNTLPVAMSKGDGSFTVTNAQIGPDMNNWSNVSRAVVVSTAGTSPR
jgi:predicted alpha/beta hydrolase